MARVKKKSNKEEVKKITNEKPISLSAVSFKDALAALLKVDPPKPDEKVIKTKPSK